MTRACPYPCPSWCAHPPSPPSPRGPPSPVPVPAPRGSTARRNAREGRQPSSHLRSSQPWAWCNGWGDGGAPDRLAPLPGRRAKPPSFGRQCKRALPWRLSTHRLLALQAQLTPHGPPQSSHCRHALPSLRQRLCPGCGRPRIGLGHCLTGRVSAAMSSRQASRRSIGTSCSTSSGPRRTTRAVHASTRVPSSGQATRGAPSIPSHSRRDKTLDTADTIYTSPRTVATRHSRVDGSARRLRVAALTFVT